MFQNFNCLLSIVEYNCETMSDQIGLAYCLKQISLGFCYNCTVRSVVVVVVVSFRQSFEAFLAFDYCKFMRQRVSAL